MVIRYRESEFVERRVRVRVRPARACGERGQGSKGGAATNGKPFPAVPCVTDSIEQTLSEH